MSLLSSGVGLRYICHIERDANIDSQDAWGDANSPDWQWLSDVPCHAWPTFMRETINAERSVTFSDVMASVQPGTDVTEQDRIASISDKNGNTVFPGPLNITSVLRYADHIELSLEQVR